MKIRNSMVVHNAGVHGVLRRKSGYKPHPWHVADFDSEVEVMLHRGVDPSMLMPKEIHMLRLSSIGPQKPNSKAPSAVDKDFAKKYPNINLLMTAQIDDEGKQRKTCTLTVVCEGGLVKAGIRDRDIGASVWRSSPTWDGLFKALEEALESGEADWRVSESTSRK